MLESYLLEPADYKIVHIRDKYQGLKDNENYVNKRFGIVDMIFMEPPVWARMGHIDNDRSYWEALWSKVALTVDTLWDPDEHLFFRDKNYLWPHAKTANGKKVFWSRGNGWALGGLSEVLQYMDPQDPLYAEFAAIFRKMCATLKRIQQPSGLWTSSLYDPEEYPQPETSGSAFFCFGFSWGINNGLLPENEYREAAERAWKALVNKVEEGVLGWSQTDDYQPHAAKQSKSTDYATGAFLLAGHQMILLESATRLQPNGASAGPRQFEKPNRLVIEAGLRKANRAHCLVNGRWATPAACIPFQPNVDFQNAHEGAPFPSAKGLWP
jgi:rhamnogalacturonyl hydrolase YesR